MDLFNLPDQFPSLRTLFSCLFFDDFQYSSYFSNESTKCFHLSNHEQVHRLTDISGICGKSQTFDPRRANSVNHEMRFVDIISCNFI
ncbi:hypothetical protein PsorP6_012082 [Peronosclerospora sorghi]|uniref:Uncharacterized protein n=1 Tax=Peronosclerospora sorghi TaxID=230839 RepID=A0ACC0WJ29_9STRA|nr:hypothetical protein PsorP6_012082 [Peronosclerospora sorghi]